MSDKLELIAYQILAAPHKLNPSPRPREWMDKTWNGFANRCLPLLMANQHGWDVSAGQTVDIIWNGGPNKQDVTITTIDNGGFPHKTWASSHFGSGIATWEIPFLFRTPPGWNLYVKGPANLPKDGATRLEGLVETDWAVASFTFNVALTRPGLKVRFLKDEALCTIVPAQRGQLAGWFPSVVPLRSNPALDVAYNSWQRKRGEWNGKLAQGDPETVKVSWQKHYFQGTTPDGVKAPEHESKQNLRAFKATKPDTRTKERVMRANDTGCKRWPEVCGEIATKVDPNSAVCQLPNCHEGPHDFDTGKVQRRQPKAGDLCRVNPVRLLPGPDNGPRAGVPYYEDYYGICLDDSGDTRNVLLSNGLVSPEQAGDLEVLPLHPSLAEDESGEGEAIRDKTAPANFIELVRAYGYTHRDNLPSLPSLIENVVNAARTFLNEYRGTRNLPISPAEDKLAQALAQLDPL